MDLKEQKHRLSPYLIKISGVTGIGLSKTGIEIRVMYDTPEIRQKIEDVFEKYADTVPFRVIYNGTAKVMSK